MMIATIRLAVVLSCALAFDECSVNENVHVSLGEVSLQVNLDMSLVPSLRHLRATYSTLLAAPCAGVSTGHAETASCVADAVSSLERWALERCGAALEVQEGLSSEGDDEEWVRVVPTWPVEGGVVVSPVLPRITFELDDYGRGSSEAARFRSGERALRVVFALDDAVFLHSVINGQGETDLGMWSLDVAPGRHTLEVRVLRHEVDDAAADAQDARGGLGHFSTRKTKKKKTLVGRTVWTWTATTASAPVPEALVALQDAEVDGAVRSLGVSEENSRDEETAAENVLLRAWRPLCLRDSASGRWRPAKVNVFSDSNGLSFCAGAREVRVTALPASSAVQCPGFKHADSCFSTNFDNHRVVGATALGLARANSSTCAHGVFRHLLATRYAERNSSDYLALAVGEVDCAMAMWTRAARDGTALERQLKDAVDRLFAFVHLALLETHPIDRVLILGATPPTLEQHEFDQAIEGPTGHSLLARMTLTLRFNDALRRRCAALGCRYADISDDVLDLSTGTVLPFFTLPNDRHLRQRRAWFFWTRAIARATTLSTCDHAGVQHQHALHE